MLKKLKTAKSAVFSFAANIKEVEIKNKEIIIRVEADSQYVPSVLDGRKR